MRRRVTSGALALALVLAACGGERPSRGTRAPGDLVVWLAGAAGPAWLARTGLPLDPRGFVVVGPTLQVLDGAPVWAAGDCATLAAHPETPKAGVYAVRQGPVLARNLHWSPGEEVPCEPHSPPLPSRSPSP